MMPKHHYYSVHPLVKSGCKEHGVNYREKIEKCDFCSAFSLFPTMPRHHYYSVQPLVKSLCKKHGVNYREKTLLGAFADLVK